MDGRQGTGVGKVTLEHYYPIPLPAPPLKGEELHWPCVAT